MKTETRTKVEYICPKCGSDHIGISFKKIENATRSYINTGKCHKCKHIGDIDDFEKVTTEENCRPYTNEELEEEINILKERITYLEDMVEKLRRRVIND